MKETIEQLESINVKLEEVIGLMKKPENKLFKLLDLIANIITIVSILAIIEIIRNWV